MGTLCNSATLESALANPAKGPVKKPWPPWGLAADRPQQAGGTSQTRSSVRPRLSVIRECDFGSASSLPGPETPPTLSAPALLLPFPPKNKSIKGDKKKGVKLYTPTRTTERGRGFGAVLHCDDRPTSDDGTRELCM